MYVPVPNQDLDLKRLISWSFCARWVQLRWEIIVPFVDIFRIDDHHCLNFLFIIWNLMLSDVNNILEVHAHYELWSFVNGGAEVCAILFFTSGTLGAKIVCQRPVMSRYVSLTVGGDPAYIFLWKMTIYSKCKYICSFKCWDLLWI